MRGASAIKDAVRAARMLNQMREKDAADVGIPEHERTAYFRVDRVKGNNSPPRQAVWRRFVNVELPNTDEVGVVVPWLFSWARLTIGRNDRRGANGRPCFYAIARAADPGRPHR